MMLTCVLLLGQASSAGAWGHHNTGTGGVSRAQRDLKMARLSKILNKSAVTKPILVETSLILQTPAI